MKYVVSADDGWRGVKKGGTVDVSDLSVVQLSRFVRGGFITPRAPEVTPQPKLKKLKGVVDGDVQSD